MRELLTTIQNLNFNLTIRAWLGEPLWLATQAKRHFAELSLRAKACAGSIPKRSDARYKVCYNAGQDDEVAVEENIQRLTRRGGS